MVKNDIVYILKSDIQPDELRYSLRSVCKNFPYKRVWFYGGCPEGIKPDMMVEFTQTGVNKWEKVNNTLKAICKNGEITEDFWLFNDDFFIMKKLAKLEPMVGGSLYARCARIVKKYGRETSYAAQLQATARELKARGYDRLDYALHVPMLINRAKGLETLRAFKGFPMFRSLYGNMHEIGGVISKDVKIQDGAVPTGAEALISTNDLSFRDGAVGQFIRDAFPDKCKYEI